MKKITSPILLKLNLVLVFLLFANVLDTSGQTTAAPSSPTIEDSRSQINKTSPFYDVVINENKPVNHRSLLKSAALDAPFDCADGLAFILTNTGTSQDNYVTGLHTLNLATNVQNLVKYPLVEEASPSRFINAIGYNIMDNFLYGLLQNTNKIAKIDTAGEIQYFDITGSFTPGYYSSGDMDTTGTLYLYNGIRFVAVNLDPSNPNFLEAVNLLTYSAPVNDLAYNTMDNSLYMVTSTKSPKLLRYDLTANTVTDLGVISGLEAETTSSFGTSFMDSMGNLFIANNSSGRTYKIASPNTGGTTATFYSSAMDGLQPGDGARCQNEITFPVTNDDLICITEGTETIIDVMANDGEGSYALDPSSIELIDPATTLPVSSVTISGQGTFTVDGTGMVTFVPADTFTETSVQYTIRDVLTNLSQPATITVYLNTTEAPTAEALQSFCASSNPTIADLSVIGNTIRWYDSETSTTVLSATTALVDNKTYYATQTNENGCESIKRLEVTVKINEDVTLVSPETATCNEDRTSYTVEATFKGTAPFTVTGSGTPGTWTDNMDGTHSWRSNAIASNIDYSFEVVDSNACNTVVLSATAPLCCTFEVECPTFAETAVECYSELPSATSYTVEEFEALGNADGRIDSSCGIVQITASNSSDNGSCSQTVTRTYTITHYEDTNNNGVLDGDETTILNVKECIQNISVADVTAPNLVTDYEAVIDITCDSIPAIPELVFEDACSSNMQVNFDETSTGTEGSSQYVVTRTWTVSDSCANEAVYTQIINVTNAAQITATDTELCNDDNFNFDLFDLLSGSYDDSGTWSVVAGNATIDGSLFNPYQLDLGTYTFKYTLSDDYCTSETLVNIELNDDCVTLPCGIDDVVISKAVTTYLDGKNDFFSVTGIESCGFTIEVQIFNRWGAKIFESNNYQNNWNGSSSKASVGSSKYVPTGTYYYVVNLKNSGLKPFAGPIYVATK
ncbi:gliding motility-associated C-terminal domain-containing protein [Gelidibacter mesophilus]|uniref:T9SS type B sorting domain-containing protein n=1 Tax=Gelidibacter mesophilus TaxID=169050 RepID=UPI0003FCC311|nr:gliding motility-associated C-terminal domain-containing protein [Gelidibacter mesophilus]